MPPRAEFRIVRGQPKRYIAKADSGNDLPGGYDVIALAGQPNVGKSTVFNMLTGLRQHVGNWTGKTVELKTGELVHQQTAFTLVDLPGTYSLLQHDCIADENNRPNYFGSG